MLGPLGPLDFLYFIFCNMTYKSDSQEYKSFIKTIPGILQPQVEYKKCVRFHIIQFSRRRVCRITTKKSILPRRRRWSCCPSLFFLPLPHSSPPARVSFYHLKIAPRAASPLAHFHHLCLQMLPNLPATQNAHSAPSYLLRPRHVRSAMVPSYSREGSRIENGHTHLILPFWTLERHF